MPVDTKKTPPKNSKRRILISDEEEEDQGPPKKKTSITQFFASTSQTSQASTAPKPSTNGKANSNSKPKPKPKPKNSKDADDFIVISDEEDEDIPFIVEDEEDEVPQKKGKSKATASTSTTKGKKKEVPKKAAPKVEETQEEEEEEKKPAKKTGFIVQRNNGPIAPGSKPVPDGKPNCLAGLTFVFTGELTSFSREEIQDLAKRFGGRVTGSPSSKTSYVVVGENAGPAKLNTIKKLKIATLDEDGFLNLIATREGKLDPKQQEKAAEEEQKIKAAARELEMRERRADKEARAAKSTQLQSAQLWTTKYAPLTLKEICGNKGQVEKVQGWLKNWKDSLKYNFKRPGPVGSGVFRALLITGPPGIGKTTTAHLCAQLEGFTPIELNASDARSKKLVENATNINNKSLDGWIGGGETTNVAGVTITDKTCLIMDEVDGMSAGDRGGVGALNTLIKKTKIPIICIANDRGAIKLKPLMNTTFHIMFRKPDANAVRSRIMTIAFKEKLKIGGNVVDQLVNGANGDVRQVLNMLSAYRLSSDSMDFDQGKEVSKSNEKYTIMTPFNAINKLLGPYLFSATSRETLNDKMELYFYDHAFIPLWVQENYLKTTPSRAKDETLESQLHRLELMDKASSAISDSDLVDKMIHGSEQHWSLMPFHAVMSTVTPASHIYGSGIGFHGDYAIAFPSWLGQNSKQMKLKRQLGDVQIRMRLKVSGDKSEIRQSYIPALLPMIVKPLMDEGASAVPEVIDYMDEYYLSKEDWDTIVELGVGPANSEFIMKKISTATKSGFTRRYNISDHPIPFHKQDITVKAKKLAAEPAPDQEDVFEVDDDVVEEEEEKKADDDDDQDSGLGKDKLIKLAKPKKAEKAAKAEPKKTASKKKK